MLRRYLVSFSVSSVTVVAIKTFKAMNLLDESMTDETKTIVEYSSGSTVISMSLMSRIYHGSDDTRAYLSNKTSPAKLKLMQLFGLDL